MEDGNPRNKGFFEKISEGFAHSFNAGNGKPNR